MLKDFSAEQWKSRFDLRNKQIDFYHEEFLESIGGAKNLGGVVSDVINGSVRIPRILLKYLNAIAEARYECSNFSVPERIRTDCGARVLGANSSFGRLYRSTYDDLVPVANGEHATLEQYCARFYSSVKNSGAVPSNDSSLTVALLLPLGVDRSIQQHNISLNSDADVVFPYSPRPLGLVVLGQPKLFSHDGFTHAVINVDQSVAVTNSEGWNSSWTVQHDDDVTEILARESLDGLNKFFLENLVEETFGRVCDDN
ncbi:hypothetical protein HY483_02570 [Candidatus Woesearchaeota archaeon]|nr:hypothetical protein [Candidatus Woesearchaeota archaeon]